MTRRWAAALAFAACVPWAAALELQVDVSGGPLVLVDQVDAVLADWRAAGVDVDAVARDVRVRYADPALLGPDAIALVVVRPDTGAFEVLVRPGAEGVRAALVPALGVVLGGALGSGALDPRVDPATPAMPNPADAAAVAARRPSVPGDVDGDGVVGFEDLLRVAAAYGRQGVNLLEDLDGDGVVDDADLDRLRERYDFGGAAATDAPGGTPTAGPGAAPATDPDAPPGPGEGTDADEDATVPDGDGDGAP